MCYFVWPCSAYHSDILWVSTLYCAFCHPDGPLFLRSLFLYLGSIIPFHTDSNLVLCEAIANIARCLSTPFGVLSWVLLAATLRSGKKEIVSGKYMYVCFYFTCFTYIYINVCVKLTYYTQWSSRSGFQLWWLIYYTFVPFSEVDMQWTCSDV